MGSVMQDVCDAWITELQTHIPELADAKVHRYAMWTGNAIADSEPGIHLAVWPESDPEAVHRLTTDGSDVVITRYWVQVWEGAHAESTRVFDDDDANAAWLDLFQRVKKRFYLRANLALGAPNTTTSYEGGGFDQAGDKRVFAVRFTKEGYETFT